MCQALYTLTFCFEWKFLILRLQDCLGINKAIKVFSMVLNMSYHDEDSDSDHTHSYPLLVVCYLPGIVQKTHEVAAIIPDVDEKTGTDR